MRARLIHTAVGRETTRSERSVASREWLVAVGLLLVLAAGCGTGRSGEPAERRKEATHQDRPPSTASADSDERTPRTAPVNCESVALHLAPLGYALMEIAPTPPERAKEWARADHPFARHADALITFFEEADTPGPVGSVRIALRCGDKWLLVDDDGNAEWDGVKGRFSMLTAASNTWRKCSMRSSLLFGSQVPFHMRFRTVRA